MFKIRYRVRKEIRKGAVCFVPQLRRFYIWFDATDSQEEGYSYDVWRTSQEEAEEWIREDIRHRTEMNDNRVLGYTNYLTRAEKIKLISNIK